MTRAPRDAGSNEGGACRLLGRAGELARIAELLQEQRFVTITGPGGMGKTTLARAVAAHSAELYPDGVCFIDLSVLAEGRELIGALGTALGIAHLSGDALARLAACLRGRRMLIVFDCCEHHTAVTAHLSEVVLAAAAGIDVLCTSREPLLARSERIVRLGPIGMPPPGATSNAASAGRFPAVELFMARARDDHPGGFVLDDRNVALVCAVCRAVEGVPLALELAAALVRPLGLEQLARQTSRQLLQSKAGWARPDERHRTLSSMLDWSYEALAPHEQQVFRSLAVFRGGFSLEAAGALAAAPGLDHEAIVDTVIELAGKSLVSTSAEGDGQRARLLDLTRDYAYAKLRSSPDLAAVHARHARWLCSLMEGLERDWMVLPRADWLALYGPWVDDVLAAVDWALGDGGELLLGARLAGVGFSLGDQVGAASAFHVRVKRALEAIRTVDDVPVPVLLRLHFVSAQGPGMYAASLLQLLDDAEAVVQLARQSGTPMLHGASLVAIWGSPFVRGDYPASLAGAQRIVETAHASADPYLELIGQRTMAQSLHFMGRHAEAHCYADQALANSAMRIPLGYLPSPIKVGTSVGIILARLLWMEGAADLALDRSEEALQMAQTDRPSALCQVLAMAAIPVALWRGESGRGRQLVARLRKHAEVHAMGFWIDWSQRLEDALAVMDGVVDARSLPSLTDRHDFFAKCRDHLATFSSRLLTDDAVERCRAGRVAWCLPELLRVRALHCLDADEFDSDGMAAALLAQSLAIAGEQQALAWALRSATTLAGLLQRQGASPRARAALGPVLARCREGQGTADMRAATALMASLE